VNALVDNVCVPAACDKFADGSASWQVTCSGAAVAAVLTKTPTLAPIKVNAPTPLPTTTATPSAKPVAAVVYVYQIILVLYGLTPAEFAVKDAAPNHALTKELQKQIAQAAGVDVSLVTVSLSSRRMLQGTGAATDKITSVNSVIKDSNGKITNAASLGTAMTKASTSITAATKIYGVRSMSASASASPIAPSPTAAGTTSAAPTVGGTSKKSAATTTARISEVTTYTAALFVGLLLAMMV